MLVLSRKTNQSIMIGTDVRVVVVGLDGDHVKLGIEAPPGVRVQRLEILDGPVGKKSAAADTPGGAGRHDVQATER